MRIERDAFIGPGAIILSNVTIGHGAVVTAGSVGTRYVPSITVVQGNPAFPVATCEVPLVLTTGMKELSWHLKPLTRGVPFANKAQETTPMERTSPAATL